MVVQVEVLVPVLAEVLAGVLSLSKPMVMVHCPWSQAVSSLQTEGPFQVLHPMEAVADRVDLYAWQVRRSLTTESSGRRVPSLHLVGLVVVAVWSLLTVPIW